MSSNDQKKFDELLERLKNVKETMSKDNRYYKVMISALLDEAKDLAKNNSARQKQITDLNITVEYRTEITKEDDEQWSKSHKVISENQLKLVSDIVLINKLTK